jgi:hypothetical protein
MIVNAEKVKAFIKRDILGSFAWEKTNRIRLVFYSSKTYGLQLFCFALHLLTDFGLFVDRFLLQLSGGLI